MTKNIRTILKPILIISYVFGFRIPNLSNRSRLWFSVLYMLLIWSVYYFIATSTLITSIYEFPIEENIFNWLESFTTLLSIVFGVYHNKKFQNCLGKLDRVDNTLLKLGTITNYDKLRRKTIWLVLGWVVMFTFSTYGGGLIVKNESDRDIVISMFFMFIRYYVYHINSLIGDLIIISILEYIGLKFDQVNEHIQNLKRNKCKIKRAWENILIHPQQRKFSGTLSSKCTTWTVIHLHLELRKISCEIDSIFGMQMTFKMACYFGWVVNDLHETLYGILINNYMKSKTVFAILHFIWFSMNVFKFLYINYKYETVCTKEKKTADLLYRLSYFTSDIELREIISQFSLRTVYAPLKFCGIGFFQFGFKFLHGFVMSVATVLVILIQAQANKQISPSNYSKLKK